MERFAGRRAVVTGASQGIGMGIARVLAGDGARVLLLDVNRPGGEAFAEELRAAGHEAHYLPCDVGSPGDVAAAGAFARRTWDGVDFLVNNAGIFPRSPTLEMPLELWERVLRTNLTGAFLCVQAFVPQMPAHAGAAIVNIASGRALQGAARGTAYASTKSGLLGFTKSLATEFAPLGIRCNAVIPGITDTAQPRQELDDEQMAAAGKKIPLGRIGQAVDVAKAVAFLLSSDAEYMTGHSLVVNGGSIMV